MQKIIVFGSINNDFSINVPRMPMLGETMNGNSFLISPGGKGENQAVAAARLGGDVHLIGRIGDDAFGHKILMSLKRENVKTTFVKLDEQEPTASAFIIRCEGNNRIIVNSGANEKLNSSDLKDFIKSHDEIPGSIFITQLEANKEESIKSLKIAKEAEMFTILNPSPVYNIPIETYKYVDLLIVNQVETETLTSISPDTSKGRKIAYEFLHRLGVKKMIITLGSKGSEIYEDNQCVPINAYKVESIDSTGAGDTYLGGIGYGLSKGWGLTKSAYFASAASALKCLKVGAQTGMPTFDETMDFIKKYGKGENQYE